MPEVRVTLRPARILDVVWYGYCPVNRHRRKLVLSNQTEMNVAIQKKKKILIVSFCNDLLCIVDNTMFRDG